MVLPLLGADNICCTCHEMVQRFEPGWSPRRSRAHPAGILHTNSKWLCEASRGSTLLAFPTERPGWDRHHSSAVCFIWYLFRQVQMRPEPKWRLKHGLWSISCRCVCEASI